MIRRRPKRLAITECHVQKLAIALYEGLGCFGDDAFSGSRISRPDMELGIDLIEAKSLVG